MQSMQLHGASHSEPNYVMGEPENPVNIWHWKADWQMDVARYRDREASRTLGPSRTTARRRDGRAGRHMGRLMTRVICSRSRAGHPVASERSRWVACATQWGAIASPSPTVVVLGT